METRPEAWLRSFKYKFSVNHLNLRLTIFGYSPTASAVRVENLTPELFSDIFLYHTSIFFNYYFKL